MTMPLATAAEARERLDGKWSSKLEENYRAVFAPGVDARESGLSALWDVTEKEEKLADSLVERIPRSPKELVDRAHELGVGNIFPRLSQQDAVFIASDGKIPKHSRWAQRIKAGELAIDALFTSAGLASFTADQKALDDRIRRLID
jgi:transaldolase